MTVREAKPRRARGTGSLSARRDKAGRETWYGRFWVGGRLVKRRIGLKRPRGEKYGLTRSQAEAALRRLMDDAAAGPPVSERLSVAEAGERYLEHLAGVGRKRATLEAYESTLRVHLAPCFAGRSLDAVSPRDVEAFIDAKRREGKQPKSVRNWLSLLNAIFVHGEKRGWCRGNPVRLVDKPRISDTDPDVRFLDQVELEALLRAAPDDRLGETDHVLYLTAAMTGLRQGELLALRWRDIDWAAGRLRVRRSYVRGEFGTPKSKRASRSVPLADRVAGELERHFQASAFQGDDDLVFAHPALGAVLDRSKVLKRFKACLRQAGVREVRFHDLRHTFGTRMAAAGVPIRTLQEWMGHRDFKTTLIYADYSPSAGEADLVQRAFQAEPVGEGADASTSPNSSTIRGLPVSSLTRTK
jgi:integrase